MLGSGAYSTVFKVKRINDGEIYALKSKLKITKEVNLSGLREKERLNALNEVRILASISHPNIIAYKDSFIYENSLCIIMEYADGGDLANLIETKKKAQTLFLEKEIWEIFLQILTGLNALHELKTLHRDLKTANIFIHKGIVKLGDLNVSKV